MRVGLIVALGVALLAGGCVTAAEQRALDVERCKGFGFHPGTDGLANCLLQVDLDRSARARAAMRSDFGPWYGPGIWYGPGPIYGRRW